MVWRKIHLLSHLEAEIDHVAELVELDHVAELVELDHVAELVEVEEPEVEIEIILEVEEYFLVLQMLLV